MSIRYVYPKISYPIENRILKYAYYILGYAYPIISYPVNQNVALYHIWLVGYNIK